jgi:hypothetical protein
LTELTLPGITSLTALTLQAINVPMSAPSLTTVGTLTLSGLSNTSYTATIFPVLTSVTTLNINSNGADYLVSLITIPSLTTVTTFTISGLPNVMSVSFPSLSSVNDLTISVSFHTSILSFVRIHLIYVVQ